MEGKEMADWMNNLSGGYIVYGYDEISGKIIVIDVQNKVTSIISLEKAHNILKTMAVGMQSILVDIFRAMVEDKVASNNGGDKNGV